MKKENLMSYKNKKVKLLLRNNFIYTCEIIEFYDDSIMIKDKFDNLIILDIDNISMVTENRGRNER